MTEHYPTRLTKSTLRSDDLTLDASERPTSILDQADFGVPSIVATGLNDDFAHETVLSPQVVTDTQLGLSQGSIATYLPQRRRKAGFAVAGALALMVFLFVGLTIRSESSNVVESSASERDIPIGQQQSDLLDGPEPNVLAVPKAGVLNPDEDSDVVALPALIVGNADQLLSATSGSSTTENQTSSSASSTSGSTTASKDSTSQRTTSSTTSPKPSTVTTSGPPSQTTSTASSTSTTLASSSTSTPTTSTPTTSAPTTSIPTTTSIPSTSTTRPPSGQVVWQDNFDQLNAGTWSREHSTYGDGNNELQCYRPENVSVRNGKLVLKAVTETYTCPGGDTRQVTSGMIRSSGVTFSPGQSLEFRVKLTPNDPTDQGGLWPAVWSSGWGGGGWPAGGELDYIEVMTAEDPNRVMSSMHYSGLDGSHEHQNRGAYLGKNFSADWHVIRFDYGRNGVLVWWLDGQESFRVESAATMQGYPAPFDQQIGEIKINLALGGRPGPLAPGALGTGSSGATFEVDYIRIIQN